MQTIYFLEGHYTSPTQPAVALSFLSILLDVLKSLYEKEINNDKAYVLPRNFYNNSLKYFHFDRIGGVLSHLKRHYRHELIAHLGMEHVSLQNGTDQSQGTFSNAELSDICKYF